MVSLSVRLSIAAVSIGRLQPAHMTPGWIVGGGAAVAFSMGAGGASPLASASGSDQVGSGMGGPLYGDCNRRPRSRRLGFRLDSPRPPGAGSHRARGTPLAALRRTFFV